MKRIYKLYMNITKITRDSFFASLSIVGFIATVISITGHTMNECVIFATAWVRFIAVLFLLALLFGFIRFFLGRIYKKSISIRINKTKVTVMQGDIFKTDGWKVIGCDSRFDLRIDDRVIAKKSLHGKLVTEHAKIDELALVINNEASRLKLNKSVKKDNRFPLGTIIPYESSLDNQKYLLLAFVNLDEKYEAHTNMMEYEQTLMRMWKELSRVYALNDIVIPLLGSGIPRFDDGPKEEENLLRCMLCTLNSTGVCFKSNIKIVLYGDNKNMKLYEYKGMFRF